LLFLYCITICFKFYLFFISKNPSQSSEKEDKSELLKNVDSKVSIKRRPDSRVGILENRALSPGLVELETPRQVSLKKRNESVQINVQPASRNFDRTDWDNVPSPRKSISHASTEARLSRLDSTHQLKNKTYENFREIVSPIDDHSSTVGQNQLRKNSISKQKLVIFNGNHKKEVFIDND